MKLEHQHENNPQLKSNMINGLLEIVGQLEYDRLFPAIKGNEHCKGDPKSKESRLDLSRAGIKLQRSLGERSSNGIMLRAGRAAFRKLLQGRGEMLGVNSIEFRLLPTRSRIMKGLSILSETMQKDLNCKIDLADEKKHWTWIMHDCTECKDRSSTSPLCYFMHGFLFEFMLWAGNGKVFPITEVTCCATGGENCTFRINKDHLVQ